jgi:hypothetical protein
MELFSIKKSISFIKYTFQICSLIVMIYQLIKTTLNYLSFLINVNLIINNEDAIDNSNRKSTKLWFRIKSFGRYLYSEFGYALDRL